MISDEEGYEPTHLLRSYDWDTLHAEVFVDIGGSHGMVSITFAEYVGNIHCIAQDLPDVAAQGEQKLPHRLADREKFMAHNFSTTQPVKNADVYFFRWIFHDWSDHYCINILRSLIPTLKEGSQVILGDFTIPQPGMISQYSEWLIP